MQVTVDNEGQRPCAGVQGVPFSAFTCWQHGCADIISLSRMATFMRRGCFQQGFIEKNFFGYRPDDVKDNHSEKKKEVEEKTDAPKSRFFVISCDIVLSKDCPKSPAVMADTCSGELIVSNISNSTFSLYLSLDAQHTNVSKQQGSDNATTTVPSWYTGAAGEEGTDKKAVVSPLGYVHITYCCINDATRRSMAMEQYRRDLLQKVLSEENLLKHSVKKMGRLQKPTAVASNINTDDDKQKEEETAAAADPVFWRHPIPLRDADTDFNGHLNQSMYIAFVVDSIKAYLRMVEKRRPKHTPSAGHHGEDDDTNESNTFTAVKPIPDATSSKVIRRLRIDYVKEVPSREAHIEVRLQRSGEREREAGVVAHTAEDDEHVHGLWFEIWAEVPSPAEEDQDGDDEDQTSSRQENVQYRPPFLASQGTVEVHSKWL